MIEHLVWVRLLLVVFLVGRGICDPKYQIVLSDGLSDCEAFTNDFFKADKMNLGISSDDDEAATFLEGSLECCDTIDEGTFIDIEVLKETEVGSEPMWSCSMDLCKSLEDEDAPWAKSIKAMNITGCPIKKGTYVAKNFLLDLGFAEPYVNYECEGSYLAYIKFLDRQRNTLSCHHMSMAIIPIEESE